MIQTIGGIAALGASAWLLADAFLDTIALGMMHGEKQDAPPKRVMFAVAKVVAGWVVAILAGVLLS